MPLTLVQSIGFMNRFLLTLITCAIGTSIFSQAPYQMPYQAIVRNSSGQIISNSNVTMRFSITDAADNGTILWQETQSITTNTQGAVSVILGSINSLQVVNWFGGPRFMRVELNDSNTFIDLGTQQLGSVPYAFYANQSGASAGSVTGYSATGDTLYFSGGGYLIVPGISAANPGGN
jgi:hypothetical protein